MELLPVRLNLLLGIAALVIIQRSDALAPWCAYTSLSSWLMPFLDFFILLWVIPGQLSHESLMLGRLLNDVMLHYSKLHQEFIAQGLLDRFIVDHVWAKLLILEERWCDVFAIIVILDELSVLLLKWLLKGGLVIEEKEKLQKAQDGEETTYLWDTIHHCKRSDGRLVEGVVVVQILEEDAHLAETEILKIIFIVGLSKCKEEISVNRSPRPQISWFHLEEWSQLSFVKFAKLKLQWGEP